MKFIDRFYVFLYLEMELIMFFHQKLIQKLSGCHFNSLHSFSRLIQYYSFSFIFFRTMCAWSVLTRKNIGNPYLILKICVNIFLFVWHFRLHCNLYLRVTWVLILILVLEYMRERAPNHKLRDRIVFIYFSYYKSNHIKTQIHMRCGDSAAILRIHK